MRCGRGHILGNLTVVRKVMFLGYEASASPSSPLISPTGVIVTAFFFLIPHHIMVNPTIPTIAAFNAAMILSTDRLFFISTPMGTNGVREWRLIQLDYESSVRRSPSYRNWEVPM